MRKFVLFSAFILMFFLSSARAEIQTIRNGHINYYGEGVINMPKSFKIYSEPDKNSDAVYSIDFEASKKSAIVKKPSTKGVSFAAFVPETHTALLTVDENRENGWYKVFINQKTGQSGWVYNDNPDDFYTYKRLMYKYGRKYGIRMFNNLPEDKKILYSKQSEQSQKLEELKKPSYMNFTVITGNWMLVTAREETKHAKVGWYNWRNDDGTLNVFPNFKEQH